MFGYGVFSASDMYEWLLSAECTLCTLRYTHSGCMVVNQFQGDTSDWSEYEAIEGA